MPTKVGQTPEVVDETLEIKEAARYSLDVPDAPRSPAGVPRPRHVWHRSTQLFGFRCRRRASSAAGHSYGQAPGRGLGERPSRQTAATGVRRLLESEDVLPSERG